MGRVLEQQLIEFPSPPTLTHQFGIGSVLGAYFGVQVLSGLLLSLTYVAFDTEAIETILEISTEAFYGNMVRLTHSAGAGLVFALIYPHMAKYITVRTYNVFALLTGLAVMLLTIASAFLGYVLVWQQMSYWAATVITSLISVAPDGNEILSSLWGNFTLDRVTLTRFYSLHYLVTLLAAATAVVHLFALHILGNSAGFAIQEAVEGHPFARYYLMKDVILVGHALACLTCLTLILPDIFADVELFVDINTMATPLHIVPEWYLLAYYATLRCIPSKLAGVGIVLLLILNAGFILNVATRAVINRVGLPIITVPAYMR